MMTRKHFQDLADTVDQMVFLSESDRRRVADRLANFCERQNGRFDQDRFLRACNVSMPEVDDFARRYGRALNGKGEN